MRIGAMVFGWRVLLLGGLLVALGAAEQVKNASPGAKPLVDPPGIHNLYLLGTNLYSGSAPEGDAAFAALARLGVKSIITVDGTKPDVDLARKYGLRYVHLPHGYDGIPRNLQLQLAKAGTELPGPIFVHCHHGKHRGPAAAAIICLARDGWSPAQAEQWLVAAGTATNYVGLYEVVRHFQKPAQEQLNALPSDFPETAKVAGLVDAMVGIDERWDNLQAVRAAGYQAPPEHPDLKPSNEALLLREHYREAQRLPDSIRRGDDFLARLKSAEAGAQETERLLRQLESTAALAQRYGLSAPLELRAPLDRSFDALRKSCTSCHQNYRDPAGIKSK